MVAIRHATQAVGEDAGNGEIRKAQWNADHAIEMATARILGRTTAGAGDAEELTAGAGLALGSGSLAIDKATAANIRARVSDKVLTGDGLSVAVAGVALTDATTIAINWTAGYFFTLTVTANRTLGNPSNVVAGSAITIAIYGNNSTERSLSFGANYRPALPEETVTSTKGLLLTLFAETTTRIVPTWKVIE
jgi:hypothetical protein